jgi:hypothetical protein
VRITRNTQIQNAELLNVKTIVYIQLPLGFKELIYNNLFRQVHGLKTPQWARPKAVWESEG